jgi:hypothetical protein
MMATQSRQPQDLLAAASAALRALGDSFGEPTVAQPQAADAPAVVYGHYPGVYPTTPLSEADWHLLLNAVKSRLRSVPANPATAEQVVGDCLEAIESLQDLIDPARAHGR